MYNITLQAPKLARKCEIKHWYTCGADGRNGRSVYGPKLWGSAQNTELSELSNKMSAENLKKIRDLNG